jgi:hypothetical protein
LNPIYSKWAATKLIFGWPKIDIGAAAEIISKRPRCNPMCCGRKIISKRPRIQAELIKIGAAANPISIQPKLVKIGVGARLIFEQSKIQSNPFKFKIGLVAKRAAENSTRPAGH